jgi:hypothetical protein
MKRYAAIAVALMLFGQPAAGAERSMSIQANTKIIDGGRVWHEDRSYTYAFRIEVISDREGRKAEESRAGRPFVTAFPGERYRVRIHNPLPVRVAANLSIDGLNSLTGRPGTPEGGRKWVVEPESWVDISGWQVSDRTERRFYFTSREESYSAWRSNDWGRDLSVNAGVIGVAYFWSQRELDRYFDDHPIIIRRRPRDRNERGGPRIMQDKSSSLRGDETQEEQQAGTGMGERESNPVQQVRFDYDRGMYRANQAVVITYDFPEERRPRPEPFEERGYAPEPDRVPVRTEGRSPQEGRARSEDRNLIVYDNANQDRVQNQPNRPTLFTVDRTVRVVTVTNYHWNDGRGAAPGTIALRRRDGFMYGPWPASGEPGQGGVPNAYWTVHPNVTIPAGSYTVVDSSPRTWSNNKGSSFCGFSRIELE